MLKKTLIALFTIGLANLLFACSPSNVGNPDGHESEATFLGTIEDINGQIALVSIEEGEILQSGSKVDVDLSVANDTKFQIGDKVRVGYDGKIMEKFPLGIHTTFVELVH